MSTPIGEWTKFLQANPHLTDADEAYEIFKALQNMPVC